MFVFANSFFNFFLEPRLFAEIFIFQPLPRFLSPLSCPGRPVPSVQPRLTGPCRPVRPTCPDWPARAFLSQLCITSKMSPPALYYLGCRVTVACAGCPAVPFLLWWSICPIWVLTVLYYSIPNVLSSWHVPAVKVVLSRLLNFRKYFARKYDNENILFNPSRNSLKRQRAHVPVNINLFGFWFLFVKICLLRIMFPEVM